MVPHYVDGLSAVDLFAMRISHCLLLVVAVPNLPLGLPSYGQPPQQVVQTITVRLLNAKTGEPMKNKMVTFEWEGEWKRTKIKSDEQGLGTAEVPAGEKEFSLMPGPKVGKEPYRIPYLDCSEGRPTFFQVSLVLEKGFAPKNSCSRKTAIAHPGEVVFCGLPKPWWVPDFQ
jgi:hypothetical protein